MRRKRPKAIELFCGCGGFSEGFEKAGFDIALASDCWSDATRSYAHNHPKVPVLTRSIEKLTSPEVLRLTGLRGGELDVMIGGPPCQGFSLAGNRDLDDKRNMLWEHFFRLVKGVRPKVIVMENVKGITFLNARTGHRTIDLIQQAFERRGYRFAWRLVDMADYGIPQHRLRIIMIANRLGIKNGHLFPKRTHGPGRKPYKTVGQTIMDVSEIDDNAEWSHKRMKHTARLVKRMRSIEEGRKYRKAPFSFVYERLHRSRPSITLVPGHSAFPVHPTEPRTLTVREAARLQTFPDEYRFFGGTVSQGLQVGNAVPPLFALNLAKRVKTRILMYI